jgi:receptor-binding and translocation channel-forming TcA subunit of Tc toxin/ABC toxin-like protein
MSDLIIIRLHPVNPTDGVTFTSYLNNLSIAAFDLSFANSTTGDQIGQASGVWTPPSSDPTDPGLHQIDINNTQIIQHFSVITDNAVFPPVQVVAEAVATAVIIVNPPPGHREYQTSDLRLQITNNQRGIADQNLDFNVTTVSMDPLSGDPSDYISQGTGVYFGLPDPGLGLDPTLAHVDLPSNGTPPDYDALLQAVNLVLAHDPDAAQSNLEGLSPLTEAQARQVAYEIISNPKLIPIPDPQESLERLYTRPPTDPALPGDALTQADQERKQFEANLTSYYATQSANAERLAGYVFAISAAIWAEIQTRSPAKVGFTFAVDPAGSGGTTLKFAEVALVPAGGLILNFDVPAEYFYAIGASLPASITPHQRYRMATLHNEQTVVALHHAIDIGIIPAQAETPENAARRLVALGAGNAQALPQCPLNADINGLLNAWLAFMGPDIAAFFTPLVIAPFAIGHLDLVLAAVTQQFQPLIGAIKAIPVNNVHAVETRTTADWNDFFLPPNAPPRIDLLPPFTAPGTPTERVAAFIRQLRNFFALTSQPGPTVAQTPETIPTLDIAAGDPLNGFIAFYNANSGTPFAFGTQHDPASYNQALQQVFPNDNAAQAWLDQMLRSLDDLVGMTQGINVELQFSLMEALYARGFDTFASVQALAEADFQNALTGTVAYQFAQQIYQNAQGSGGPGQLPPGTFRPVNPDGSLLNCVPPWHLSPLGPVEYLHELLQVSARSTCDNPQPGDERGSLAVLLASRRGNIGSLHATAANLHTPLPMIDLVNESLEALASGSNAGTIYDTNPNALAGHNLRPAGKREDCDECPEHHRDGHNQRHHEHQHHEDDEQKPYLHDPETMFAAIPEHSSPATPVDHPNGYDLLQSDFSAPGLPYSQPLDISRSYLCGLGSNRFATMRTFRKDITEFVLNPALEPADFQRNLWRYPVRIEIACEYLGISPEEYDLLYTKDIVTAPVPGHLLLRALYGFSADIVNGQPWTDIVVEVPEFLQRTCLSYREFLELWESQFVTFQCAGREPSFPDCEPCCPEKLIIQFDQPEDPLQALKELAVFIRLWRTLRSVSGRTYSFTELCDIGVVLNLFAAGAINPDFIRQLAAFQMLRDQLRLHLRGREEASATAKGADRTSLLALWVGPAAGNWNWAVAHLLDRIEDDAEARHAAGWRRREMHNRSEEQGSPHREKRGDLEGRRHREGSRLENSDEPRYRDGEGREAPEDRRQREGRRFENFEKRSYRDYEKPRDFGEREGERREKSEGRRRRRSPEFMKVIRENLDRLSSLAGFNPSTPDTWHAKPASTLRFAEVLAKIYLSDFTVGEILFLFTVEPHLDGDDPFPEQDLNEALDSPLDFPAGEHKHGLWALRRKLLAVHPSHEAIERWTWDHIVHSLRNEFGYSPPAGGPDPLQSLGEHFFPDLLAHHGYSITPVQRQYRVDLPITTPGVWNLPPHGPFHYDTFAKQLCTRVPLCDGAVDAKLSQSDQLSVAEQSAVQQLYFSPRADLAPFALIFDKFTEAEHRLIEEEDERERWHYFRREFARFHARCHVIAKHLTEHISSATDRECEDHDLAWTILRRLFAVENRATVPWEQDSGQPPASTLWPLPTGGAFAALLGLTGTGLLGRFTDEKGGLIWNEVRGPIKAFGHERNEWNSPFPTVLPSISLTMPDDHLRFAALRNGFAIRDVDGDPLGGAEGFEADWSGALLVEHPGSYEFFGASTHDGHAPNFGAVEHHRWRVSLQRGQKTWLLLNHGWPGEDAPDTCSAPLSLKPGAYHLQVQFAQNSPRFAEIGHVQPNHTGFELTYKGPDNGEELAAIPLDRLFREYKDTTLAPDLDLSPKTHQYLALHYTSSLRDIRCTYQLAFKGALVAHRSHLSARLIAGHSQSELGYMLDNPELFLGTSYFPAPGPVYHSHHAYFDFNFLPVADPYHSPNGDQRAQPSLKRQQALFDWWERIYDYDVMRRETKPHRERPVWLLFLNALDRRPADPSGLVQHLGIDLRHAPPLLSYYKDYSVSASDLTDERWAIRLWHGEKWIQLLLKHFAPSDIGAAKPALWVADDAITLAAGNTNLMRYLQDGCFENGEPRRYEDVKRLNDKLRECGRTALLAHLCGMGRVPLSSGPNLFAQTPKDLSELLLQDVEVGICEKASRIDEAITAVQTFVERARLGLEPGFIVKPSFAFAWERLFATYRIWQACKRRVLYRENWIEWEELEKARKVESYQFLESEIRRSTLTVSVPGGVEYWPDHHPPAHSELSLLQSRELSYLRQIIPAPENLGLMGKPDRDARSSWLATVRVEEPRGAAEPNQAANLPFWIQAAIRLGVHFLRVAAAGEPPASTVFEPRDPLTTSCCIHCGKLHSPVTDEYYFWLIDSKHLEAQVQDADWGTDRVADDPTIDWERPDQLPGLLNWPSNAMVRLHWCRVHNGEFQPPRRSDDGAYVLESANSQLEFLGRTGDSLRFSITGGDALPEGFTDPSPRGFRYDIATDTAVVLPQVVAPAPSTVVYPGALNAYPFFAYFAPGAPLVSLSMFSPAVTVAGVLRTHCHYDAALKWYELYFNPLENDCEWSRCGKDQTTPPPSGTQPSPGTKQPLPTPPVTAPVLIREAAGSAVISTRPPSDNPCCEAEVVSDLVVHQRAILLHYLETLAAFGDAEMCRNSPEAFQKARLIYDMMERILGVSPMTVFSQDDDPGSAETVINFVPRFAALNPRLMNLYCLVADRLTLIHHCLNARRARNGRRDEDMSYWGNSLIRHGWRTALAPCESEEDYCCRPRSPYRFMFLVQKAQEIATDVRGLGGELLAAFEKGDSEYLASLRAAHERQLLNLTLEVRQNEWREADWQLQALRKTKEGTRARRQYYADLIANGFITNEQAYVDLTGVAIGSKVAATIADGIAQAIGVSPDMFVGIAGLAGTPVEINQVPVGTKLAGVFSAAGRVAMELADISGTSASLALTQGGWDRREQDWRQQVQVLDIEIEQIERQILAAERRRDVALRQLNTQQQQIEQSAEVQNFLRDKFTSHALYLHLQQETAALHRQMFELALCAGRQAQRAFNNERPDTIRRFLPEYIWDNLHDGLLAGDRLQLALRQMEKAYMDQNVREYELTKHFSLRLDFPIAFLRLKSTGCCEIELDEWRFDQDYNSQFMRQIKNVSMTAPCLVGPYTGVHCRLTLLSSATRVDPCLLDVERCCPDGQPRNGYKPIPADPRIVRQYGATEAVATSSAQSDSGLFEMSFRDERYLPFEYAGAVSRWRIELRPQNNRFDRDTIDDVVLHLNYIAREGGDVLGRAADEVAGCHLPGDGWCLFDVRHDFPDAWHLFHGSSAREDRDGERHAELRLKFNRNMFPFVPGHEELLITGLALFFETREEEMHAGHFVEFLNPDREDECTTAYLPCLRSAEWPRLYHGVLDTRLGPLGDNSHDRYARFRFGCEVAPVKQIFLFCHYEVMPRHEEEGRWCCPNVRVEPYRYDSHLPDIGVQPSLPATRNKRSHQ